MDGVRSADRASIGRAITLVESNLPEHREMAQELLTELLPLAGSSHRIGITGVPGSAKALLLKRWGARSRVEDGG